jgi:Bacterial Ig domain
MHRRAAARGIRVTPALVLLVLTLVALALLGGALGGTAAATSQATGAPQAPPSSPPTTGSPEQAVQPAQTTPPTLTPDQPPRRLPQVRVYLQVQPTQPAKAAVAAGERQGFTATVWGQVGPDRWPIDVTGLTSFSVDRDGRCWKSSCAATTKGLHTITGVLPPDSVPLVPFELRGTSQLLVVPGNLTGIRLQPGEATVQAGVKQTYTVKGVDRYGNERDDDLTSQTEFTMGAPGSCAKDGATATCMTTEPGDYPITGKLTGTRITGKAILHVVPEALAKLVLKPNSATVVAGTPQRYQAEGFDAHGEPLGDYTTQTKFAIRHPGWCTNGAEANCTATKIGTYTVTGTVNVGSRQVTGEATLHVDPGNLERLELRPGKVAIPAGAPQSYQAEGFDAYSNPLGDLTARTGFSIDPTESCTIVAAEVTCTIARSYKVTGTLGGTGVQATADLLVRPGPLAGVQLQPDNAEIQAGTPQPYTVTGIDRYGNTHAGDLTATTDFSISPSASCAKDGATANCTATKTGDYTVTGILAGTTFRDAAKLLVVPGELAGIRLAPDTAEIQVGVQQPYTVRGVDRYNNERADDLAGRTSLSVNPPGSCTKDSCTAPKPAAYIVTATLNGTSIADTAELLVVGPSRQPSIATVTPGFTAPGTAVEIRGTTGSCSRVGTLTLHGTPKEASANVTGDEHGDFLARFTVPTGTFPNAYKLELTVDCNSQLQRAEDELTVINLAPVAVDDAAYTTQDTPVAIAVTANDRNPDPDTGYPTLVLEHGSPANGTIQVQPDGIIIYTPHAGFLGQDQFQYDLCDNVINAAGTADCGLATVVVTVNPTTGGSAGGGPAGGGSTNPNNPNACVASAGDLREHLQVAPVKGSGGTRLRITAQVDPKLAACRLRLLLGGAPLGPDLDVGLDGSVAAQPAVPPSAIPGSSVLRLATTGGQVLDQTSFEIVPTLLRRWWERNPYRLLLGVGALLGGALARATLRRVRRLRQEHDQDDHEQTRRHDLRADPHTRPHEVTVAPDIADRPALVVRLQSHPDAGALTLREVPG